MREGIAYAVGSRRVRVLLALVIVAALFGMPYQVLLPVFARDVLGAGSSGLGLLMGAAGLGAVGGALYLAARRTHRRSAPVVAAALAAFGGGLVAFAFSRTMALSVACMVVVGAALIVQMATSNTLLQLSAPGDLRGRVISLYLLAFATAAPIGALAAGWIARRVGAPWTVAGGGAVCLLAAAAFAARIPSLRRAAAERTRTD
jgi:MFS family permease